MANAIAQFNIQFDALEDRLQLRVLSTNDEEIRLWLTRRFVRLLLKALADKFGTPAGLDRAPLTAGFAAGVALGGDKVDSRASLSKRFSDPYLGTDETSLPLGEQPQLVSRIALQEAQEGNINLMLGQEHEDGMQIELGLNLELVHSLQVMLVEAATSAEWDLAVVPVEAEFERHLSGVVLH